MTATYTLALALALPLLWRLLVWSPRRPGAFETEGRRKKGPGQ